MNYQWYPGHMTKAKRMMQEDIKLIDLLIELKNSLGMSIIFISHDLNVIRKISDRVMVMKSGKIVEENSCENIFKYPKHSYTKTLIYSFSYLKESIITTPLLKSVRVNIKVTNSGERLITNND